MLMNFECFVFLAQRILSSLENSLKVEILHMIGIFPVSLPFRSIYRSFWSKKVVFSLVDD